MSYSVNQYWVFIVAVICFLCVNPVVAIEFEIVDTPPKGFEVLAQEQLEFIDVFYGGRFLISTLVNYDDSVVRFDDSEAIIEVLPDIKDSAKAALRAALVLDLAANREFICKPQGRCLLLQPQIVGVVFDRDANRLDLYINSTFRLEQTLMVNRYLPKVNNEWSSLVNLTGLFSGQWGDEANSRNENTNAMNRVDSQDRSNTLPTESFNLAGSAILGYGPARLQTVFSENQAQGLAFDQLSIGYNVNDYELNAGTLTSQGQLLSLLSNIKFAGIRFAKSFNLRTDLDAFDTSPITIFLEERSRVSIFKDNRLVDIAFYEAGNQQLDTRRLPRGNYTVRIKIEGNSGREKILMRFINKTRQLPPQDDPFFFLDSGILEQQNNTGGLFKSSGKRFIRSGATMRFNDQIGLSYGLTWLDKTPLVEAALLYFNDDLKIQAGSLWQNNKNFAFSFSSQWQWGQWGQWQGNASANMSKSLNASDAGNTINILPSNRKSLAVGLGRVFYGVKTNFFFEQEQSDSIPFNRRFGVSFSGRLWQSADASITWSLSAQRDQQDTQWSAQFRYQARSDFGRISYNNRISNKTEQSISLSNSLQSPGINRIDQNVSISKNEDTVSVNSVTGIEFSNGEGQFSVQKNSGKNSNAGLTARFGVSIGSNQGHIATGRPNSGLAGVLVVLEGERKTAPFEILVNEQSFGVLNEGADTLIPLPPFASYDIRIRSLSEELLEFNDNSQTITLVPGTIRSLRYQVQSVTLLVGQVINEQGFPVKNARINNVDDFALSDDQGYFQVELTDPNQDLQFVDANGVQCQVQLPKSYSVDQGVAFLEGLVCVE